MKKKLLLNTFLLILAGHAFSQSYDQLYKNYRAFQEKGSRGNMFETGQLLIQKYPKKLIKDPIVLAEITNGFGNYYFEKNLFDSAMTCFSRAVNITYAVKKDTSFDYGFYLNNLAYVLGVTGNYEKAESYYYVSLPLLAKFLGSSSMEYTIFYKHYVEMKIDMGDYEAASPLNEALLYYFKTMKGENDVYYLNCINNKARIFQGSGDYKNAALFFKQSLESNKLYYPKDTVNIATTLNNMAECYRMMGDYRLAEPLYLEALKMDELYKGANPEDLASLLNNMGLLYKANSDYYQSEKCFLKSISYYKTIHYENNIAYSNPLNNIGDLYRLMGNIQPAIYYTEQAVTIRKNTSGENHEYYANAIHNLAMLYMEADNLKEAETLFLYAEEIYKKTLGENNLRYANCLSSLASLYLRKKDFSKALHYNTQCLQLMEKNNATLTDKYALYLSVKGQIEYDMKDYNASAITYQDAARIFKTTFGDRNFHYLDMLHSLANVYHQAKNDKEARHYYLRSMEGYKKIIEETFVALSEEEKANFFFTLSGRFETFYDFMIEQAQKPSWKDDSLMHSLFQVRLLDKSLLLDESTAMIKNMLNSSDTTIQHLSMRWLEQKQYLQELYQYSAVELKDHDINLEQEERLKNVLEKKLNESAAGFKESNQHGHEWEILKSKLTKNDLAIDMIKTAFFTDDGTLKINYAALIIGKEFSVPKLVALDSTSFFDTLFIAHYKKAIQLQSTDVLSYNRFYKALEPYTTGKSIVYFSGDGIYQQMNLYTLYHPLSRKYLVESAEIVQVNSLKDIPAHQQDVTINHPTAYVFGFPDYDLKGGSLKKDSLTDSYVSRFGFTELPELPGTKKETEEIASLFRSKNWTTHLFLAQQATETQVKQLSGPNVLHIATHGYFLPDEDYKDEKLLGFSTEKTRYNPLLRSGLMMAGAAAFAKEAAVNQNENGILTAYEASLLNLQNTQLVTLSACETGLGELVTGQGVYGLQRAFLTAGAKSVLMSLWTVDDEATQELMISFYKNFLDPDFKGNKSKALKKAQMDLKQTYPSPYFWGAFVLITK